jgi:hypothetical protein
MGAPYLVLLRDVGGDRWSPFFGIRSSQAKVRGMLVAERVLQGLFRGLLLEV